MKAAPDDSRMKAAPDVSRMKAAPDVSRMKAAPDVSRMKAAPDVSRMKAAPDVSRMKAAPVLLVLLLLCVCEVGVGGAQECPPSLSDVMREVHGLKAAMAARCAIQKKLDTLQSTMAARCAIQKKLDTLQSNLASRLSASEAKMGEDIVKLLQELQKSRFELVQNDLANVTDSYKLLHSSYQQLISTCNPVTEEEQKKRLNNLCGQ